jgi:hypothetical protein
LPPGQISVFLSDVRTDVLIDCNGHPADDATAIPVFDGLAKAEAFAEQAVARMPSACASIYDYHGRSGDPLRRVYHESIRRRYDPQRRARRDTWAGGGLLCAFAIWAFIAAFSSDEHFLWFYIIGIKLLVLGAILFVRGVGFLIAQRWQK